MGVVGQGCRPPGVPPRSVSTRRLFGMPRLDLYIFCAISFSPSVRKTSPRSPIACCISSMLPPETRAEAKWSCAECISTELPYKPMRWYETPRSRRALHFFSRSLATSRTRNLSICSISSLLLGKSGRRTCNATSQSKLPSCSVSGRMGPLMCGSGSAPIQSSTSLYCSFVIKFSWLRERFSLLGGGVPHTGGGVPPHLLPGRLPPSPRLGALLLPTLVTPLLPAVSALVSSSAPTCSPSSNDRGTCGESTSNTGLGDSTTACNFWLTFIGSATRPAMSAICQARSCSGVS
mmetsp:Transcript_3682/g.5886  ORF Transcript_3682/g.5886 Transcript_3682/m.5886 type:complete len:291 (+) Transcript_3682:2896-3768(+)